MELKRPTTSWKEKKLSENRRKKKKISLTNKFLRKCEFQSNLVIS